MTAWMMNAVGLLATTIGALLIFLYVCKAPAAIENGLSPEVRPVYARHRKMLTISIGLLAAWLLVQYLALILV
jgi:hypothetical protein